jgi:hypothetical protein
MTVWIWEVRGGNIRRALRSEIAALSFASLAMTVWIWEVRGGNIRRALRSEIATLHFVRSQ